MLSLNALNRGTGPRRWLLNQASRVLYAGACVGEDLCHRAGTVNFTQGNKHHAELVIRSGLPLLSAQGTADEIGNATGSLLTEPIRALLKIMGHYPPVAFRRLDGSLPAMIAQIDPQHYEEICAVAHAAGIRTGDLLAANVLVDTCCSALVKSANKQAGTPLTIARNMDFFPARTLAEATLVSVVRPKEKIAFASIGWPGCSSIVSGFNAHGLSSCILLNYDGNYFRTGTPIGFRARHILETCKEVESAWRLFTENPVASDHYLLLADESQAAIVWQDAEGFHRHDLKNGWLACSNGQRNSDQLPIDDRGQHLLSQINSGDSKDETWMRRSMSASYLAGINTQAMIIIPAEKRLQLALGSARQPAALSPWIELELSGALMGQPLNSAPLRPLPQINGLPHYLTE